MSTTPQSERNTNFEVLSLADASSGSPSRYRINCINHTYVSLHYWWGTTTGAFTLFSSDKAAPGLSDDTDWVAVPTTEVEFTDQPDGSAGSGRVAISANGHAWLMVKYTDSGGSGALNMRATLKR